MGHTFQYWIFILKKEFIIPNNEYKLPSERKVKIYILLVIIFLMGIFKILPKQFTTIIPAIIFIWETFELFFNKNALAGYKIWFTNKTTRKSELNLNTYTLLIIKSKQSPFINVGNDYFNLSL